MSEPPLSTSNSFDDLWSAPASTWPMQATTTPTGTGPQKDTQDSMATNVASNWSDFMMPLLAACESEAAGSGPPSSLSTLSESVASSVSSCLTSSSTVATDATAQQQQPQASGCVVPDTTATSHTEQLGTQDHNLPFKTQEVNAVEHTQQLQRHSPIENENSNPYSLNQPNWPQADSLALWFDQDVCLHRNTHAHRQPYPHHSQVNSNVSIHLAQRPNSPQQQLQQQQQQCSRPLLYSRTGGGSGYTLIPLMGPHGLL